MKQDDVIKYLKRKNTGLDPGCITWQGDVVHLTHYDITHTPQIARIKYKDGFFWVLFHELEYIEGSL